MQKTHKKTKETFISQEYLGQEITLLKVKLQIKKEKKEQSKNRLI